MYKAAFGILLKTTFGVLKKFHPTHGKVTFLPRQKYYGLVPKQHTAHAMLHFTGQEHII